MKRVTVLLCAVGLAVSANAVRGAGSAPGTGATETVGATAETAFAGSWAAMVATTSGRRLLTLVLKNEADHRVSGTLHFDGENTRAVKDGRIESGTLTFFDDDPGGSGRQRGRVQYDATVVNGALELAQTSNFTVLDFILKRPE